MTEALPPRPHLGQLKRQARELLRAALAGDLDARGRLALKEGGQPTLQAAQLATARRFGFASWAALKRRVQQLNSADPGPLVQAADELLRCFIAGDADALARIRRGVPRYAYYSDAALRQSAFTATDAREVIAREAGYDSWSEMLDQRQGELDEEFEEAVRCVVLGKARRLRDLLLRRPELVRARSSCSHRATLLHYVTANGVEDHRQRTPPNAVEIAEILLQAGAEPDALSCSYDGGSTQTPLYLMCSSAHPHRAGLTSALVECFCRHGALPNGLDNDGLPLATAIVFGITPALDSLIDCGARVDNLVFAAAAGDVSRLNSMLDTQGRPQADFLRHQSRSLSVSDQPRRALEQAFAYAALHGRLEMLRRLAALGASPDSSLHHGETGLHWAAVRGDESTLHCLIELGATAGHRDRRWKASPLDWADNAGRSDITRWLLRHAAPDLQDRVRYGDLDDVRRGLQHGSPDGSPADGQPLRTAVRLGDSAKVELLLAAGARLDLLDPNGKSALHEAVERGDLSLTERLLQAGADPRQRTHWNMTPLEWAANNNQAEVAARLRQEGETWTLWTAAALGLETEVKKLLQQGASADEVSAALYIASRNGRTSTVQLLLAAGGDLGYRGFFGGTALHWAALGGHLAVVELLLQAGADTQLRDERFHSLPLGWAYEQGRHEVFQRLLQAGVELNLREAAEYGCEERVRELLAADPDAVTFNDGVTPLEAARRQGHQNIEQILIAAGAEL